jgi:hypothetical protein
MKKITCAFGEYANAPKNLSVATLHIPIIIVSTDMTVTEISTRSNIFRKVHGGESV